MSSHIFVAVHTWPHKKGKFLAKTFLCVLCKTTPSHHFLLNYFMMCFSYKTTFKILAFPKNDKDYWPFKHQPRKMVKHTQTIRQQKPTNCLRVFDQFVGLALKGLNCQKKLKIILIRILKFDDVIETNHVISHIFCFSMSYKNFLVCAPSFKPITTLFRSKAWIG